ncbi:MAG: DUF2520 domain-containing protein [Raineya sp.]|nr:DUF2520 domain-containing protein [Raineya sp.]
MKTEKLKIAILGTGNVAWHLAKAISQTATYQVVEIWGRNEAKVNELAQFLQISCKSNLDFRTSKANIILLAISDSALPQILRQIQVSTWQVLAHTSGSTSIEVFENLRCKANFGVFYPLQTFSKNREVNIHEVPFCIEANSAETQKLLWSLAESLSSKVFHINSHERLLLHLAAVFANNFVNHLFSISQEILQKNNLPFELLVPLIKETCLKAIEAENIKDIQTGPARRKDTNTIQKHLNLLQADENKWKIYEIISQSIMQG